MYYLCLGAGEGSSKRVNFVDDFNSVSVSKGFRVSPIFPVDAEQSISLLGLRDFKILFCYPKSPFSLIGRLSAKLNDSRVGLLWFSHGLASLIVVSDNEKHIDDVLNLLVDEVNAYEIWTVKDKVLVVAKSEVTVEPNYEGVFIEGLSSLPNEIQALLYDYLSSINVIASRSEIYLPYHKRVLMGIHSQVEDIVVAFKYIYLDEGIPEEYNYVSDLELIRTNDVKKLKISKRLTDQLLQINSALSYVLTQGYSGIVPIVEHDCPLRGFSLLGTGAALNALEKIYESVSSVFAKYPVARCIHETYGSDYSKVPIFKNNTKYSVDEWKNFSTLLDQKLVHTLGNELDQMSHLSFFSGTRGFRETLVSISTALQALTSGSDPRWSLVTLTHEYLHAHVRAILAVLQVDIDIDSFSEVFEEYQRVETSSEEAGMFSLKKRLLFILISSCELIYNCKSLASDIKNNKSTENSSKKIDLHKAYELLQEYYRDINEYIVHTLDFLYFFEGKADTYINMIWLSWATLPEIYDRLNHYLLRTLLATSVKLRGNINERFQESKKELCKIFSEMLSSNGAEKVVISRALDMLNDETDQASLLAEFSGCVKVVDMTTYFFNSLTLHGELKLDDLQVSDDSNDLIYPIEDNTFIDQDIQSPVAFLVDRAKKKIDCPTNLNFQELMKLSCWEFLVVCSAELTSGGN